MILRIPAYHVSRAHAIERFFWNRSIALIVDNTLDSNATFVWFF